MKKRSKKRAKKQIIDITGTPLTPSLQGEKYLGNGLHPDHECCCDECNYFLACFPEYTPAFCRKKNDENI